MPHVFAVFLIVAASGALNVASIASVFGRGFYKPLAPLSGLLAVALLAGGLAVLVLDLGRADRLVVAMTYFNFKSIFAWNIYLYTGFFAIVAAYLWTMMERRMNRYSTPVGFFAFAFLAQPMGTILHLLDAPLGLVGSRPSLISAFPLEPFGHFADLTFEPVGLFALRNFCSAISPSPASPLRACT